MAPQNRSTNDFNLTVLQALMQKHDLAGFLPTPATRSAFLKIIMQYSCKLHNMVVYIIVTSLNK